MLVYCPNFFESQSIEWSVTGLIHELAHSVIGGGPMYITDRAYQKDRLYGSLSTGEALTNAESYALFVRELLTGAPVYATAPIDTYKRCPPSWRAALIPAIARAQRWNRDAQWVLKDSVDSDIRRAWEGLARKFLGGQSPDQVAAAQTIYDEAQTKLLDEVDFQCETTGGGRCDGSSSYWYALGHLHVCPSLITKSDPDDRAQELLAGLYGYYRIIDDDRRRDNLAALARNLHKQFFSSPSAADLNKALSGAGGQP
jgi:hypothetical protein